VTGEAKKSFASNGSPARPWDSVEVHRTKVVGLGASETCALLQQLVLQAVESLSCAQSNSLLKLPDATGQQHLSHLTPLLKLL
jgi:hypothetical protein